ncbi:MAG TPA: hypothetical protein VE713_14680 [Pyrinomonadaceae bacterium]|nr:hypothetical protein [Pyrinomonadaceae bacterium]
MSLKSAVARRYLIWFSMFLPAVVITSMIESPFGHAPAAELLIFFAQALFIGSLIALSLGYFSVRVNNEQISRLVAASFLLGTIFFPNFGPALFGRIFATTDPVISALLIVLMVSIALNVVLYLIKRRPPPDLH